MERTKFNDLLKLFAFDRSSDFEERLFNNILIISIMASLIFDLNAIFIIKSQALTLTNTIAVLVFTTILIISKIQHNYARAKLLYSAFLILILDAVWFVGGGFYGFNGYIVMLQLTVLLIINKSTVHFRILFIVIINTVALFIIEYLYPQLPVVLEGTVNMVSQGVVLIVSLLTLFYFIVVLKRNYSTQKEQVEIRNRELNMQKIQLAEQSDLLESQNQMNIARNDRLSEYSELLKSQVDERSQHIEDKNEDLLAQNVKLDLFTFIVAHTLRLPVSQLKGLSNILNYESGRDRKVLDEVLDRMKNSIDSLESILLDLLKILDIQKGYHDMHEQVNLNEELSKTLELFEDDIIRNNVVVQRNSPNSVNILGNRVYVESILFNLISNAIKFRAPDRTPEVHINISNDNGLIEIDVEDNGIGIDMTYAREKIFKLYQRFDLDRPGRGFGLFLTKSQVEALRGTIDIESEVGKGSKFKLTFPLISNN